MSEYKKLCQKVAKSTKILTENMNDPNAIMAFMYFCHSHLSYISESDMRKAVKSIIKGKTSKKKVDDFWNEMNNV